MTTLQIRPILPTELATLLTLIQTAYAEYDNWLTPPSGAHNENVSSLAAKLEQGAGAIAWQEETPVGSVLFEARDTYMYLGRLAVPPLHRKRGIGALLVRHVEDQARAQGLNKIALGVRLQLPENTAFYTNLGYHIESYGIHPGFTEPTYMTMAKVL